MRERSISVVVPGRRAVRQALVWEVTKVSCVDSSRAGPDFQRCCSGIFPRAIGHILSDSWCVVLRVLEVDGVAKDPGVLSVCDPRSSRGLQEDCVPDGAGGRSLRKPLRKEKVKSRSLNKIQDVIDSVLPRRLVDSDQRPVGTAVVVE